MQPGLTYSRFQTTRWPDLLDLASKDGPARTRLLDELAARYWPPVYAHLRHRGLRPAHAADMAQEFFTQVVLGRRLFERACEHRGRLRNLILTALANFRIDQNRRSRPGDRLSTPAASEVRFEEATLGLIDGPAASAATIFDRRWAIVVLEEAMARCRQHFLATGRHGHWRLFEQRVLDPARSGNQPPAMGDLWQSAGFSNAAHAVAAVQVVKRRLSALLLEVIGETVDTPDIDDELAFIRRVLGVMPAET